MPSEFATQNIIFNAEGQAATRQHLYEDALVMCHFSRGIYKAADLPAEIEVSDFLGLTNRISSILAKNVAIDTPSVFKRVTAFTVAFVTSTPLKITFFGTSLDEEILRIRNHQNAIVAFEYCRQCLHGAKINHQPNDKTKEIEVRELTERIAISNHSYVDTITAIAQVNEDTTSFQLLTLLYESYAYRSNPTASYQPLV